MSNVVAPAAAERDSFDLLDCFNEDLVWIVDRLVARAGGEFGLITRHVQGEDPKMLARSSGAQSHRDGLFAALAVNATVAIEPHRRRHDDDVCMRESTWMPSSAEVLSADFRILQLTFSPTQNVSVVATVCRPDGAKAYDQIELLTASRLYPVLSKYVRLWWLHRMERRRANALSAALDLSDVGVLLLDRRAQLLFANVRAMSILERNNGLGRDQESIKATEPSADLRFQLAIQQALLRNRDSRANEVAPGASILPLLRVNHRRPLLATVMNVRHAAVDFRDAAAIIYVFEPEQDLERILEPACRIYKLTGAEARLVHHLMSGLRITEAAERMQIRPDTARAYLKQVFAKTATNRQVDLIRLMFASMLRTSASVDLTSLPGATETSKC